MPTLVELIDAVEKAIPSGWTWLLRSTDETEEWVEDKYFANVIPPGPSAAEDQSYGHGPSPERALMSAFNNWKSKFVDDEISF